jgi:hypothetical protein
MDRRRVGRGKEHGRERSDGREVGLDGAGPGWEECRWAGEFGWERMRMVRTVNTADRKEKNANGWEVEQERGGGRGEI